MLELRLKKLYFLKKAFIIFHEMELFLKNTDDSDITMNRTRKRAWRNEQQVSTNRTKLLRISKLILTLSSMIISNNFQKKKKNLPKE